jgi:hypothetical protein
MAEEISVGKEILSYCNKCKATLAHIIVTMKGKGAGKCTCKTCDATHAFKDPAKANATKKSAPRKKKKKVDERPLAEIWADAIKSATVAAQAYSTKTNFNKGDLIDHPTFGQGFVERTFDGSKIEVIFEMEIKTLVHNK